MRYKMAAEVMPALAVRDAQRPADDDEGERRRRSRDVAWTRHSSAVRVPTIATFNG